MDFRLVVLRGRSASQTVQLGDGATTVGRQDDCQLRIKSSQVSRKHCRISERGDKLLVEDLGSSNGTFVNGVRIEEPRELVPGDTLTVGPISFRVDHPSYQAPAGAAAAAAAAAAAPKAAGDTAIVEALIDDGSEDEFELDFDEGPATAVAPAPAPAPEPAAPAAKSPAPAPPKEKEKAKEEPKPEPEPDGAMGDDAVADFLMNTKLDDD